MRTGIASLGDQRIEDEAEGEKPDDRGACSISTRGRKSDQHQCDARKRAEQSGSGYQALHLSAGKRQQQLHAAHDHGGGHSEVPRLEPRIERLEPRRTKSRIGGTEHQKAMPIVEGVSRPKGMAVTSLRPVRCAKRTASPA